MNDYDIANAPTERVITREYHRIATLGNPIIFDPLRTRILPTLQKPTWKQATAKMIKEKTKKLRRLLSTALK